MGCKQSTPVHSTETAFSSIGKTSRGKPRTAGIGHTERLMSAQIKRMQASSGSGGPTVSLEVDEEITGQPPKLNGNGHLVPEEVARRTSSSLNVSSISVGNKDKGGKVVQVQYAYRSQRGYYPDDPMKANQDKYGITLNFAGEDGDAMFAVYDGHGSEGHDCAAYSKKKLPQSMAKYVRRKRVQKYMAKLKAEGKPTKGAWNPKQWPLLGTEEYETCCREAFHEVNQALRNEKSVDDKLSGTTAVTVCFHGGRMTVCNVGDSRVVVGHRALSKSSRDDREEKKEEEKCEIDAEQQYSEPHKGEILAIPLTRDQTPYRKDERERIRKEGGEIKSIDQMEGREDVHDNWGDMVLGENVDIQGDPPRVWVEGANYPGTAFTRSLGDKIAEDIGVNAEPEIITKDLTVNDEYLVIASDGIFEFLTNQEVLNICEASFSPLQACELLTKAAYDKWLEHENRTDDITIIVCFLTSTFKPSPEEENDTTEALVATAGNVYGTKPLRSMLKPGAPEVPVANGEQAPESADAVPTGSSGVQITA